MCQLCIFTIASSFYISIKCFYLNQCNNEKSKMAFKIIVACRIFVFRRLSFFSFLFFFFYYEKFNILCVVLLPNLDQFLN